MFVFVLFDPLLQRAQQSLFLQSSEYHPKTVAQPRTSSADLIDSTYHSTVDNKNFNGLTVAEKGTILNVKIKKTIGRRRAYTVAISQSASSQRPPVA